ncbi:dynein heavy chain axonemal [Brachionus plicatilis]|uniref:Dynein heavy chain axonemal n=1 Tax=Brachionus plicatilis TaxID=10195 RepID=A0A3M7PC76_BRAPC|nr:dynein heavy chain axonemal [Brachionus plicatilis]
MCQEGLSLNSNRQRILSDSIGEKFIEGVKLDLEKMFDESDQRTPLVCYCQLERYENMERKKKESGSNKENERTSGHEQTKTININY